MEELRLALERLQRNIDEYENSHDASCPTCGISPLELYQTLTQVIADEIVTARNQQGITDDESESEEEYLY